LLPPVYERLTEGFATADLAAAKRLLATLGYEPWRPSRPNGLARDKSAQRV